MDKEYADKAFQSVHEAQQEGLSASYGNRNRKAYELAYGPFKSEEEYLESVGEILISEIF